MRFLELKRLSVKPAGSFIVAYPSETYEDFEETINVIRDLPLVNYFVSVADPIPDTPIAEEVAKMDLQDNLLFISDTSSFGKQQ